MAYKRRWHINEVKERSHRIRWVWLVLGVGWVTVRLGM